MYTAYYNLTTKPFQISSDVTFIWLGEKHREALATLRYGILDNKGFLLLTGDVGTGKTTLINALIASLSNDVIYASVPDPSLDKMDFFNYIAAAFGLGGEFSSKGKFLTSFSSFLNKVYASKKKVLLIIDESQLLTQELLEEIRLLSNIVTRDSNPLLNIFFVGQYEFNELIRRPENRAIAQRLTLNYYIEPLSLEETGEYIRHRLKIAGTAERIFTPSAIKEIFAFSGGFPRKINIICDHCLMSGYAEEKRLISPLIVKESIKDLQIPEHRRERRRESRGIAPQPESMTSVASGRTGEPAVQDNYLNAAMKSPIFWPISGFLLLLLVVLTCSFIFLSYTKMSYRDATDFFASIQDKIGMTARDSSGKNMQPEPRKETVVPDNKKDPKPSIVPKTPSSVKQTGSAQTVERPTSTLATLGEKTREPESLGSGKKDGQAVPAQPTQTTSAVTAKNTVEAVASDPAPMQPVSFSGKTIQDPSAGNPGVANLPLPEQPLVIRFENDSNLFSVSDIERMKEFATIVRVHPEATIDISGYTDSTGDEGYNKRLSEFRANMVKSFLMGQNLSPAQIRAQGFGSLNPIDTNDTVQGRTMNRRVEISATVNR